MAVGKQKEYIERYGRLWKLSEGANDLNIELACYKNPVDYSTDHSTEFHFRNAFRIMWPEDVFEWNNWSELMCWAWCTYPIISVMGHASAGKTYNTAHFVLLDYLSAPQETATSLVTTKFDALKTRLWSDLMIAINNSRTRDAINSIFRTVSSTNEMKFWLNGSPADTKFLIQGLALDKGDKNAGKIRGHHVPRRRIVADEAQDVADSLYLAMENAMTGGEFKGVLLTNPVEKQSMYGEWSKPKEGWGSIEDSTLFWETKRGICLHLDGRQSPNVKARKTINKNIMSWEYWQTLDLSTPAGHMFGLGFFPPDGMVSKIWPSNTIERARRSEAFDFAATPCATLDPAFDSDDCFFIVGELGTLRDGKPCCCARESIIIQTKVGPGFPEKDFQIARECIRLCKERSIQPENFIQDLTGNARGVYAIMRNEWTPMPGRGQVQGIYYGGEATDRPLRTDDPLGANEQVKRFVTELWLRASYLARDGMLCGLDNIDPKVTVDLDARRYTLVQESDGKRMVAETKKDLKARIGRSPDGGDAFCQFAELMVRKGLLGGKVAGLALNNWDQLRARAKLHQKRYTQEFSHGTSTIQK
jgi:hypothetical protein